MCTACGNWHCSLQAFPADVGSGDSDWIRRGRGRQNAVAAPRCRARLRQRMCRPTTWLVANKRNEHGKVSSEADQRRLL